ncbi:TetR/AcrR family transcriptional regulator [Umezawaea sp. NPDC059074]|uniref:TetR/AcrR family transcriptional regulator n=1 Tax=Umezawaea sp. NPDC059074 TaxID=3346716 RepID=UPI00368267CB
MPEPKSRRRGALLEQAILDAAWAELRDVGYARFTIEAVANRAGTSKPVIYRRWAGRAELVFAAWGNQAPVQHFLPDSGTLRGDLLALFEKISRRAGMMMNEVIAGVMSEAFQHPELAALLRDRLTNAPIGDVVRRIVQRGVDRGEIPPVELSQRVARLPFDLIRNDLTLCGKSLPGDAIAELVDEVYLPLLRGLAAD